MGQLRLACAEGADPQQITNGCLSFIEGCMQVSRKELEMSVGSCPRVQDLGRVRISLLYVYIYIYVYTVSIKLYTVYYIAYTLPLLRISKLCRAQP